MAAPVVRRLGLPLWHPATALATWFGSGLLPVTPGTWGSLAALPFAWVIQQWSGPLGLAAGVVIVFAAGWWASSTITRASGLKDPGAIVVDEVAAQWLVLLPAPNDPVVYGLAFFLFRVADILKPWPASWADRHVKGGLGVMIDDLFAALYALVGLGAVLALRGLIYG